MSSPQVFMLCLLVGLSLLGFGHTFRVANKIVEHNKMGRRDFLNYLSALDMTCILFFGLFVIAVRRVHRFVRKLWS